MRVDLQREHLLNEIEQCRRLYGPMAIVWPCYLRWALRMSPEICPDWMY
jgi:hypothetical protein